MPDLIDDDLKRDEGKDDKFIGRLYQKFGKPKEEVIH